MGTNAVELLQILENPNVDKNNVYVHRTTGEILWLPSDQGLSVEDRKDRLATKLLHLVRNKRLYRKVPAYEPYVTEQKLLARRFRFAYAQTQGPQRRLRDAMSTAQLLKNFSSIVGRDPALGKAWEQSELSMRSEYLEAWGKRVGLDVKSRS